MYLRLSYHVNQNVSEQQILVAHFDLPPTAYGYVSGKTLLQIDSCVNACMKMQFASGLINIINCNIIRITAGDQKLVL